MKIIITAILALLIFQPLHSQKVRVVDFEKVQPELNKNDDTVRVINFWATWCVPCVEEMPYFTCAHGEYSTEKVKFLLVSLDFPRNIKSQVIPFIDKHNIQAEVILLDDPDANSWINKVDSTWSGALPATIVYKGKQRSFLEGGITYEQLKEFIEQKL